MALNIVFEERDTGTVLAALSGRLDSNTYLQCQEALEPYLNDYTRVLMLDLKNLEFISSAGLRVVLAARKALKGHGGKVLMVHMQPQIEKVFEVADILPKTDIFESMESADAFLSAVQHKETLKDMDWGAIEEDEDGR
ncbi:MAG: anti-sigma factor antagonist [Spartobacteria bacterium]|nr:anti-sigma factor antagonist [Spartobacteria bacterium]